MRVGHDLPVVDMLQSARSVWRQSIVLNGKHPFPRLLQSARSVWRQRMGLYSAFKVSAVAICTERVEAKGLRFCPSVPRLCCNLHGACGGKDKHHSLLINAHAVAICTERVEAKVSVST